MSTPILRTLIDELKARTDIVALIEEDIQLSPCGAAFKGRSPFNEDRDPSFVVWPDTQTWRDFSGGGSVGGDCFDYLMEQKQMRFHQALHSLAVRAEVELPGLDRTEIKKEMRAMSARQRIEDVLTQAAIYYRSFRDGRRERA